MFATYAACVCQPLIDGDGNAQTAAAGAPLTRERQMDGDWFALLMDTEPEQREGPSEAPTTGFMTLVGISQHFGLYDDDVWSQNLKIFKLTRLLDGFYLPFTGGEIVVIVSFWVSPSVAAGPSPLCRPALVSSGPGNYLRIRAQRRGD